VSNKGITQFYLPPTQELHLSLLQGVTALWLMVLIAPTHKGMARLS